jgi:hypothetical protein
LVRWLENNWPELSYGLNVAKTEQEVTAVLKAARPLNSYAAQPPFYKEKEKYSGECWKFVQSKRYRQNPRNLASAMAGLPEISGKTSFDRCSKFAADCAPTGYRAYRDYLRRKFHDRFLALTKANSPEEVTVILLGSRSTDRTLRYLLENPDKVLYWLECGIRGNIHLNCDPTWNQL